MRSLGPRATDAVPLPIPAEENAAPLYGEAYDVVQDNDRRRFECEVEADGPGESGAKRHLRYSEADWSNPDDMAGLTALMSGNARALELIDQAAKRPGCRFDVDWSRGIVIAYPHLPRLGHVAGFCAAAVRRGGGGRARNPGAAAKD